MSSVPDTTGYEAGIRKLEAELRKAREHGARLARSLHKAMARDLRAAQKRARQAERTAAAAEKRAARAEAELARIRSSATWRAGRAVVAVPAAARRALRRGGR
jgi:predicted  nucleic acid-binding Zn-ribbon protein